MPLQLPKLKAMTNGLRAGLLEPWVPKMYAVRLLRILIFLTSHTQPVGLPIAFASRLIPAKNHETEHSRLELKDALMNAFANSAFSQLHITTPYGFNGTKGLDTSVHPIWRSVLYQVRPPRIHNFEDL